MSDVNYLDWTSLGIIIVGALNWGLEGLKYFTGENLNLVNQLLGNMLGMPGLENGFYLLVGLAGLYQVYFGYELYTQE